MAGFLTTLLHGIGQLLGTRSLENPSVSLADACSIWGEGAEASSGHRVNRETALSYAAVWRAVNLISRDVAKLPLLVYRRQGEGKERATAHPAYQLLKHRPNPEMTSFVVRQTMQAHVLLQGNAYAYIYRNAAGYPVEIYPLDPEHTYPVRENGRLWYVHSPGGSQELRRLNPVNVLHIKGLGYDGLIGYSVLTKARETLGLGLAARKYGSVFFRNDARPSVVLEHPGTLSEPARQNLRASWARMHSGVEKAHGTAVLEEGMTLKAFSWNAEDAQLCETRQFEIREIANFFGVPPHKLGDITRTAFASLEQENQAYLDDALDPWLVAWEEELREKLLTEDEKAEDSHAIEFLRQALVRANLEARGAFYASALTNGWMNRDEVRARENLNPLPDGEGQAFFVPLNMAQTGDQPAAPEPPEQDRHTAPQIVVLQAPPVQATADPGIDRDRLAEALGRGLRDARRRVVRRIALHAARAAKKPAEFLGWLDTFGDEHRSTCVDMVAGSLEAMSVLRGEYLDPAGAVDELFSDVREGLLEVSGTATADQLSTAVEQWLARVEDRLAEGR